MRDVDEESALTQENLERFLSPRLADIHNPFELADMDKAVARVFNALRRNEAITVYGDYDSDGTTATALLVHLFRFLGYDKVSYYIPLRLEEGYGLNIGALENIAKQGTKVVLTVDNGITAVEEARHARRLGLDLVITDHHRPGRELPDACAIVNPNRPDCHYPFKYLAGVGVAFKFAHALLKAMHVDPDKGRAFLRSVLDLVAIGTVADIAPLVGENRIFVTHGLKRMRETPSERLRAMYSVWGIEPTILTAQTISFRIGPRLNAAGRTDDARVCVELLTTDNVQRAARIASDLDGFNQARRDLEAAILRQCLRIIEKEVNLEDEPVLVVHGNDWHIGVLGIVASRLTEAFYRPAIVLSRHDDYAIGSGRSPESFNLHRALAATSQLLLEWGGHAHAAGVRLLAKHIDQFRAVINDYAHVHLEPDHLIREITIDTEILAEEFGLPFLDALGKLEPYGEGNPLPVLAMRNLRLIEEPRIVGSNHLKLRLGANGQTFDAIGFGLAGLVDRLRQRRYELLDVAFSATRDDFTGCRKAMMELKDLRFAGG
jgi:single-stranded-DNA-specific exonuclease